MGQEGQEEEVDANEEEISNDAEDNFPGSRS